MKILNFGSLNIDYVYAVEHFVRAGETVASHRLEKFCGGKGLNQSIAFARAGAEVYHAGQIGSEGDLLTDMLKENGVDTRFVAKSESLPTGHAVIQVSQKGENCILLYGGANHDIHTKAIEEVFSFFSAGDWLILQNEINNLDKIIRQAHAKGMTVVLNPSPFNQVISSLDLSCLDWLILNETEGCDMTGKTEPDDILSALLTHAPHLKIVLTLGMRGSIYADRKSRVRQDVFPAAAVDTTAAGDTFTGYFFASLLQNKTPAQALAIASVASAIAVSRKGAAPSIPTWREVAERIGTTES